MQASATRNVGADPPPSRGKPKLMGEYERMASIRPAGVLTIACAHRGTEATRETPSVIRSQD
jgi:hypothetical protein